MKGLKVGFIFFPINIKLFIPVLPNIYTGMQYIGHMLRNSVWIDSRTKIAY